MSESEKPKDADSNEPKIVVDDDWKAQVAKEKEAAMAADAGVSDAGESGDAEPQASNPAATPPETLTPETLDADTSGAEAAPVPPATFEVLLSMMFTQGMSMLGQMPDPVSGQTSVNKPYAKHTIDTLDMLGEKTKGNLSSEESKMLSEVLHALRMAYVNVRSSS